MHIYLNEFGAASLDVMLYVFFKVPDWSAELDARHRLAIDIVRLAERLGVEFAFPTQTLYLKRGGTIEPNTDSPASIADIQSSHLKGRDEASLIVKNAWEDRADPPSN